MVALIGTAIERNTMVSSTSDRPTTTIPNGSSAPPSRSETSMATAVKPVTVDRDVVLLLERPAAVAGSAHQVLGLRVGPAPSPG